MKFEVLDGEYSICRLNAADPIPVWLDMSFSSITRTENELSVVSINEIIPQSIPRESGWRLFRVAGQIDFEVIGVIAQISQLLTDQGISQFVISTFDTDYVLVKSENLDRAIVSLESAGHQVSRA